VVGVTAIVAGQLDADGYDVPVDAATEGSD